MKKLILAMTLLLLPLMAEAQKVPAEKDMSAYVFTFFNDSTHSLFIAVS